MKKINRQVMISACLFCDIVLVTSICFPKVLENLKIETAQVQHMKDDDYECKKKKIIKKNENKKKQTSELNTSIMAI